MHQLISVIIPTYNRAILLSRAVQSVIEQTIPPFEIIVIDDGSTDHTETMLATDFPSVIYCKQSQQGVSAGRNKGIQLARSPWLAFLDSDDQWLPNKLAQQQQAISQNPSMKLCHSDEIWIRNGLRVNPHQKHQKKGGWIFQHCLPLCAISPSSVVIHQSIFDRVGLFDENLLACEDYDLWLRVTHQFPVLYVDQRLLVKYGGHEDQLSRKYWGMDRFRITALDNLLKNHQLQADDRIAARQTLITKLQIYLAGARKRNKHQEVLHCDQLLKYHTNEQ
jgi:glycosyltransferase involved in cell wall biosynthesis